MVNFSEVGVESFYYSLTPSGGKLREKPEYFYVEEIFQNIERSEDGKVLVLKIRAKNWENNRLIRFIARSNHVSPKRVYFAGTKDRRSLKVQYFSIPGLKFREFTLKDVEILDHFYLDKPLTLGSHLENAFKVRVIDCNPIRFKENCTAVKDGGVVPNYYGPQRFGPLRPVTHLVGKEMVKGRYEEAVRVFIGYPGEDRFASLRKEYFDDPSPKKFVDDFPRSLDLERKVMYYLINNPEDYVGAIKQLPDNLVSMFIHAYQGFIFNRILSKRLKVSKELVIGDVYKTGSQLIKINPMNIKKFNDDFSKGNGTPTGLVVGYESESARGEMGKIEEDELAREEVSGLDFKLPFGFRSKGERRDLFLRPRNIVFGDCNVEFSLPPGGYATSVLREIMRVEKMENY